MPPKEKRNSKNTSTTNYFAKSGTPTNPDNTTERKKKLYKFSQHVIGATSDFYLNRMGKLKSRGFYRENMFGHEIIWNKYRYTFDDKKIEDSKEQLQYQRNKKNMFIFACVKRDAEKYASSHEVKPINWLPSIEHNDHFTKKRAKICGTDVDGAYWRIAWQLGIISEKTYRHGIRISDKALCLAALANMGSDKVYRIIDNGQLTSKTVIVRGKKVLKDVYNIIRYTCFTFMQELARMLKNDFIVYKTDCIYYIKTQRNIQMVTTFLDDHELDHKMITSLNKMRLFKA